MSRRTGDAAATRKVCVVVLGSGRSGTSLISRMVRVLGVQANFSLDEAGDQNPHGFAEDAFVVDVHKRLSALLGRDSVAPVRPDVLQRADVQVAVDDLAAHLSRNTTPGAPWSFKDPRTADFLALWRQVFNTTRTSPKYVLCVRNPASVVASFATTYNEESGVAELVWFNRTLDALYETGLNCFIVHYEQLIAEPLPIAKDLADFIFDGDPPPIDEQAVRELVDPALNRSAMLKVPPLGPMASALYEAVAGVRGADFDREALGKVVRNLIASRDLFLPWLSPDREPRQDADDIDASNDEPSWQREKGDLLSELNRLTETVRNDETRTKSRMARLREECARIAKENSDLVKENLSLRGFADQLQVRLVGLQNKVAAHSAEARKMAADDTAQPEPAALPAAAVEERPNPPSGSGDAAADAKGAAETLPTLTPEPRRNAGRPVLDRVFEAVRHPSKIRTWLVRKYRSLQP